MKRYGNLYEKVISVENLRLADEKARIGKRNTYGVRIHDKHREANIMRLHETLQKGEFRTSPYKTMTVYEPKERLIYKLPYYPDRIVHHAIMNVIEKIWVDSFTSDTYANIKGRGIHSCANRIRHLLYVDHKNTRYCLKIDIRKYYPSIDHDVLKREVRRKIKDARLLALIDGIIDSENGLPIGNYLSQYLANVCLSRFDHRLKEVHHVKYYFRYVDDMVFMASTKEELRRIIGIVRQELVDLNLELKDNWQIFPIDARGVDFLGYRFFHNYTLLRKRMKMKIFHTIRLYNKNKISDDAFRKTMASYNGWLKWCDSYRLRNKIENTIKTDNNERQTIRQAAA